MIPRYIVLRGISTDIVYMTWQKAHIVFHSRPHVTSTAYCNARALKMIRDPIIDIMEHGKRLLMSERETGDINDINGVVTVNIPGL